MENDPIVQKLAISPGINKNTTELDSEGTYISCDKVRFHYGRPEKIGGWQKENTANSIKGIARDAHSFVDLQETKYLGIGTSEKLYLFTAGDVHDITPIVASACGSNVINIASGTSEVVISLPPVGGQAGDWFLLTQTTADAAGITFSSTYQIASAAATYFTFIASASATTCVSGFGGTFRIDFLLPSGRSNAGTAFGWGAGTWSTPGASASAGWGEPRGSAAPVSVGLREWSLDNYGEYFLASPKGGNIYIWYPTSGLTSRAQLMSSAAPSIVNTMLVAQDGRYIIAFGTHTVSGDYDPLLVRWSDSEDFDVWDAAVSNEAGEFRLENGSYITGVRETKREILVFTDESLYSMKRTGNSNVFSFSDLGKHNGLISKHGSVDVNGKVYWMGFNTFHMYDGTIKTLPCTIQKYIFDPDSEGSVNFFQKDKIYCNTIREFNEVVWFYPSKESDENDRYVLYNYLENLWYYGTMDRTVWSDVDIFSRPYAIDTSGNLLIHEQGKNADTAGFRAVLKTSFFDLDDGDKLMFVERYIPDNKIVKDLNITFNYKKYPQAQESFTKGPFTLLDSTQKIHPRVRGRQCQLVYSTSTQGGDFRIGSDRLAMKPDGKR